MIALCFSSNFTYTEFIPHIRDFGSPAFRGGDPAHCHIFTVVLVAGRGALKPSYQAEDMAVDTKQPVTVALLTFRVVFCDR